MQFIYIHTRQHQARVCRGFFGDGLLKPNVNTLNHLKFIQATSYSKEVLSISTKSTVQYPAQMPIKLIPRTTNGVQTVYLNSPTY